MRALRRRHRGHRFPRRVLAVLAAPLLTVLPCAQQDALAQLALESFGSDPAWDGLRNRSVPANPPTVTQSFGWRQSNNAGGSVGELGGSIARSTTPAWYADVISVKTLNDTLVADGLIALPSQSSAGAFHIGWFNDQVQGWRPWSSIGFRLDGNGNHSEILIDYMTQTWKAGGRNLTDANASYRILHNNSSHFWQLTYDPNGNGGGGTMTFQLDGLAPLSLNLDPGHKLEGANFNRFGVMNQQTPSGSLNFYLDDVHYNGTGNAFGSPSFGWEAHGNNVSFPDPEQRAAHNYGFSNTNHAGGSSPGELGGIIWRPSVHQETYYGAPTQEALSLENTLYAAGKVALVRGATDGGMYLGWFNKESIENTVQVAPQEAPLADFLALKIEGPTRIGHYFRPAYAASDADVHTAADGPIILPDAGSHDFTLLYDPAANNGIGRITLTLDDLVKVFDLTADARAEGALFDHFGMFGFSPDGAYVEVYFDDLVFTTGTLPPAPQWAVNASGNWHTTSNWVGANVPNGVGASATFGSVNTAGRTVFTNSDVTVGALNFDSPHSWLLTGLGTLTLQANSGPAIVNVAQGTHHINLPLVIASDADLVVAAAANLFISDPVTVGAGRTLSHLGAGTVTYQSTVTLGSGASVVLAGDARVEVLAMAEDSTIDLRQGAALLVANGDYESLREQVRQGSGGEDGFAGGILSSDAARDPAGASGIAVVDNRAARFASFNKFVNLRGDEVLLKQTWYGDADLNGLVELADFERFIAGFEAGVVASWLSGDFDLSGSVDAADFARFLLGLAHQPQPRITADFATALEAFASREGLALDLSSIPEPGMFGLAATFAAWSLRGRRRAQQSLRPNDPAPPLELILTRDPAPQVFTERSSRA